MRQQEATATQHDGGRKSPEALRWLMDAKNIGQAIQEEARRKELERERRENRRAHAGS
jgi:predicted GIY-YIG superfamily endonuclease